MVDERVLMLLVLVTVWEVLFLTIFVRENAQHRVTQYKLFLSFFLCSFPMPVWVPVNLVWKPCRFQKLWSQHGPHTRSLQLITQGRVFNHTVGNKGAKIYIYKVGKAKFSCFLSNVELPDQDGQVITAALWAESHLPSAGMWVLFLLCDPGDSFKLSVPQLPQMEMGEIAAPPSLPWWELGGAPSTTLCMGLCVSSSKAPGLPHVFSFNPHRKPVR